MSPVLLDPPARLAPTNAVPGSRVVATFTKNSRETVVASLYARDGRPFADLRVATPAARGGVVLTAKGLTLSADQLPELRRLVAALEAAAAATASGTTPAGGPPPRAA